MIVIMFVLYFLIFLVLCFAALIIYLFKSSINFQMFICDMNWHFLDEIKIATKMNKTLISLFVVMLYEKGKIYVEKEGDDSFECPPVVNGEIGRSVTYDFVHFIKENFSLIKIKMKHKPRRRKKLFDFEAFKNFDWLRPQPNPVPVRI